MECKYTYIHNSSLFYPFSLAIDIDNVEAVN